MINCNGIIENCGIMVNSWIIVNCFAIMVNCSWDSGKLSGHINSSWDRGKLFVGLMVKMGSWQTVCWIMTNFYWDHGKTVCGCNCRMVSKLFIRNMVNCSWGSGRLNC